MLRISSLFLLVFVFISFNSEAQNRWLRSAGGSNQDEAFDVVAKNGGGYYLGGYFNSTADFDGNLISSNGFSDAFIQSINDDGSTDWVVGMGGTDTDRIVALDAHPDGGVVAIGFFC